MFKRLRERIVEEATKFPVGQLGNTPGKLLPDSENKSVTANSSEDLITLSDSSSVVVPHTSTQQFSIGEDEDGSLSEQSTPQKKNDSTGGSESLYRPSSPKDAHSGAMSDVNFCQENRPTKSWYIPQSDIESEREEIPTLNLDGISKDRLLAEIQSLKAKAYKYKNKYAEVVKNFKELRDEKTKIENLLTENQDKGLRRIAELREQCQLEQKAKAHLEANLRLLLEEKDSRISVLETQINLLKEGENSSGSKSLPDDDNAILHEDVSNNVQREEDTTPVSQDSLALQEKIERLEHQHKQAKKTITAQTDQITLLRKQNESLSKELEEKVKKLNELEDEQVKMRSEHEFILKNMQIRLEELEKQQEESIMSMAETKKNMHEELELKEKQLIKAEEEARQFQAAAELEKAKISELQKQHEEKINELQHQLESTEKALEEEKQNLMQELNRGKTAAITLMKQENEKKVAAIEEEWKSKLQELQLKSEQSAELKAGDLVKELHEVEEKYKTAQQKVDELNSLVSKLEKENASLKNTVEKLESENLETHHEESLKCMKDKLENAEKNYRTQMEEMKLKFFQLEKEKSAVEDKNKELLNIQTKFSELKVTENDLKSKLKSKEEELNVLQQRFETVNKEQMEKNHSFQESMKDKENMIVKLKTNLELITKENFEKIDDLNKRIKTLEEEREQLMLQAQERVSNTEAKCREDIRALQEANNRLLSENKELEKLKVKIGLLNNQLDESLLVAEANQAAASKEITELKEQLAMAQEKVCSIEKERSSFETQLSENLQKLQTENKILLSKTDNVEQLKAEKEELNEKLKSVEKQVTYLKQLEEEQKCLKEEKESIIEELKLLKSVQKEVVTLQEKVNSFELNENLLKTEIENLKADKEKLMTELSVIKDSLNIEKESFTCEKEKLLKRISLLENFDTSDSENAALKDYIAMIKGDYETALKAKETEMESKLKQLVKDFCVQMDGKDKDCDQMISEMIEKSQNLEERLQKEYRNEIAALKQDMFEKACALEEMRESYEEALHEKDEKIKELELAMKNLSPNCGNASSGDWDDTWAVPEEIVENSSPVHDSKSCKEHLQQIESLQEELSKSNSEIKELKILLRLSPPESMVNNNNRRDSLQSIPEPTEFEYLKNIIYEYMMGKEPVTLAKVIAAVLRFNDVQTQQVIRREEARHPAK